MFLLTNKQTPLTTPIRSKTSDPARVAFISLCLLFPSSLCLCRAHAAPGDGDRAAAADTGARALPGPAAGRAAAGAPRTPAHPAFPSPGGPSGLFTSPGVRMEPNQTPLLAVCSFHPGPVPCGQLGISGESPRHRCNSRSI